MSTKVRVGEGASDFGPELFASKKQYISCIGHMNELFLSERVELEVNLPITFQKDAVPITEVRLMFFLEASMCLFNSYTHSLAISSL
jgi:hypothetical protein